MLEGTDFSRSNTPTHSCQGLQSWSLWPGSFRPSQGPTLSQSMSPGLTQGTEPWKVQDAFRRTPRKYLCPILLHEFIINLQLYYTSLSQQVLNGKEKLWEKKILPDIIPLTQFTYFPQPLSLTLGENTGCDVCSGPRFSPSTIRGGEGSLRAALPEVGLDSHHELHEFIDQCPLNSVLSWLEELSKCLLNE